MKSKLFLVFLVPMLFIASSLVAQSSNTNNNNDKQIKKIEATKISKKEKVKVEKNNNFNSQKVLRATPNVPEERTTSQRRSTPNKSKKD